MFTPQQIIQKAKIKYQLEIRGLSLKKISEDAGYSSGVAKKALNDSITFPTAEKLIADALDTTPEALWPNRFDENGKRKRKRKKQGRKASAIPAKAAKRAQS